MWSRLIRPTADCPANHQGTDGQGGDDRHIPTTSRPGRPVVASYDEEVSSACSAVMRAVAVSRGPVLALAAAISRAAEGALVSGGITRKSQRPAVEDSSRILCGSSSDVNQPTFTTWPLTKILRGMIGQ